MTTLTLAAHLEHARQRRALSCRLVAELAGLTPNTVRRVLHGHDAKVTTVVAIADALRITLPLFHGGLIRG